MSETTAEGQSGHNLPQTHLVSVKQLSELRVETAAHSWKPDKDLNIVNQGSKT